MNSSAFFAIILKSVSKITGVAIIDIIKKWDEFSTDARYCTIIVARQYFSINQIANFLNRSPQGIRFLLNKHKTNFDTQINIKKIKELVEKEKSFFD